MQTNQKPCQEQSNTGKPRLVFLFAYRVPQQALQEDSSLMKEPAFRKMIEECHHTLYRLNAQALLHDPRTVAFTSNEPKATQVITQFTFQLALAALWHSWGVVPDAVMGEGSGELAAACVAGKLSLEEALLLLYGGPELLTGKSPEGFNGRRSSKADTLPFYSTMIGRCEEPEELITHWKTHFGKADLSIEAFDQLLTDGYDIFLEIGPPTAALGGILVNLQQHEQKGLLLSSCNEGEGSRASLFQVLESLSALGYPLDLLTFSIKDAEKP